MTIHADPSSLRTRVEQVGTRRVGDQVGQVLVRREAIGTEGLEQCDNTGWQWFHRDIREEGVK